ncbi:PRC-barrel domain containing protein [Vallicoccus soli]|uniref:PRC-barrel domain containing protein n=2 Tax=Vallicoccus soli TaxID=2339232 RepID=A0A3A3YT00_9ACTN|nr:PRC-barrel domain containing protein [Vallicoccus soli]
MRQGRARGRGGAASGAAAVCWLTQGASAGGGPAWSPRPARVSRGGRPGTGSGMTLPDLDAASSWIGRPVLDRDGESVGTCVRVLADDATGTPEWLSAELPDGTRRIVPLVDATPSADAVRVSVTRRSVVDAPADLSDQHVSAEQERSLYAHYGVAASTAASPTVLPAVESAPATGPARLGAPVRDHRAQAAGAAAVALALGAAAVGVVVAVRARRRPATPAERIAAAARLQSERAASLARSSAASAQVLARQGATSAQDATRDLRRTAAPALAAAAERTGEVARRAGEGALGAATTTAALAVMGGQAAVPAAERAAEGLARAAGHAGGALAAGGAAVAGGAHALAGSGGAALTAARPVVAAQGAALAGRAAELGSRAAELGAAASPVAGQAAQRVAEAARTVATEAGTAGLVAAAGARSAGAALGGAAADVADAAADSAAAVVSTWRRTQRRLALLAGLAGGYVLGARAGRGRYEQLKGRAEPLLHRPEVERVVQRAQEGVDAVIAKVTGAAGSGAGPGGGGTGGAAPAGGAPAGAAPVVGPDGHVGLAGGGDAG